MGRSPCCSKQGLNRGAWTALEDKILSAYIKAHGEGKWRSLPKRAGLKRCGKSCRLRWMNYLRPDIKRGNISHDEEELIIRLHKLLGNRWSLIAGRLPGRTDNEIKNYWNTTLIKKANANSVQSPRITLETSQAIETITSSSNTNSPLVIRSKATRCPKLVFSLPCSSPQPPLIEPNDLGIHDERYKNQAFGFVSEVGRAHAQVDYDRDKMLQLEEEPMLKYWTDICLQDNTATFDLDSFTSFLNSDEWP